jgi:hypothetical protein
MLPSHRRRSGVLPCAAPRPPSLWVREELSHHISEWGVKLVHEDVVVGIRGFRGRPRLSVDKSHPLHHQHLSPLRSWDAWEWLQGDPPAVGWQLWLCLHSLLRQQRRRHLIQGLVGEALFSLLAAKSTDRGVASSPPGGLSPGLCACALASTLPCWPPRGGEHRRSSASMMSGCHPLGSMTCGCPCTCGYVAELVTQWAAFTGERVSIDGCWYFLTSLLLSCHS